MGRGSFETMNLLAEHQQSLGDPPGFGGADQADFIDAPPGFAPEGTGYEDAEDMYDPPGFSNAPPGIGDVGGSPPGIAVSSSGQWDDQRAPHPQETYQSELSGPPGFEGSKFDESEDIFSTDPIGARGQGIQNYSQDPSEFEAGQPEYVDDGMVYESSPPGIQASGFGPGPPGIAPGTQDSMQFDVPDAQAQSEYTNDNHQSGFTPGPQDSYVEQPDEFSRGYGNQADPYATQPPAPRQPDRVPPRKGPRLTYSAPPGVPGSRDNAGIPPGTRFTAPPPPATGGDRRFTYDAPPDVPFSSARSQAPFGAPRVPLPPPPEPLPLTKTIAAAVTFQSKSDWDSDKVAAETRASLAEQLNIPLEYITILQVAAVSGSDTRMDSKTNAPDDYAGVTARSTKPAPRPTTDTPISRQHFQALKAMFTKLDRDNDGRVDVRDFIIAVRKEQDIAAFLHLPARVREGPTKEKLIRRFYQIDRDHSNDVTFEEFVAFCAMGNVEWRSFHAQLKMPEAVEYLPTSQVHMAMKCFIHFDLEDSGFIDKQDFLDHFIGSPRLKAHVANCSGDILSASQFLDCCDQMANGGMSDADFATALQLA